MSIKEDLEIILDNKSTDGNNELIKEYIPKFPNKCIICESKHLKTIKSDFVPFLKERMFNNDGTNTDILYCADCNFYYSQFRPTDEQMKTFYTGYRNEDYQKQREIHESFYTKEFNHNLGFSTESMYLRKSMITNVTSKYIDPELVKNLLDYGGDSGQYIPDLYQSANKYIYEVSGVKPLEGITSINDEKELENINWNLIMCCQVLEHVSYPMDIVKKLMSIMPVNSYLYIEVPYESYVEDFTEDQINSGIFPHIHEHINLFRKETFDQIFNLNNFIILENKYTSIQNGSGEVSEQHIQCFVKKIENNFESLLNSLIRKFLKQIFYIKNEKKHIVLRILGLKIKIRRREK